MPDTRPSPPGLWRRPLALGLLLVLTACPRPAAPAATSSADLMLHAARTSSPEQFRQILQRLAPLDAAILGEALLAAFDGDHYPAIADALLEAGADPDAGLAAGSAAIGRATLRRKADQDAQSLDTVRRLLARGAFPNPPDELGWTPLMHAAASGDLELARLLVAYGGDPRPSAKDGRTALDLAGPGPLRALLEATAERKAALWSDPSLAALQVFSGTGRRPKATPPSAPRLEDPEDRRGRMLQALGRDDLELLADLLDPQGEAGAVSDADLPLDHGQRPLMLVRSAAAAEMLLAQGADPNRTDGWGATALHHAVLSEEGPAIVPMLLAAGADVRARDRDGATPLNRLKIVFIEFRDPARGTALLRQLVAAGADIDARDHEGYTLLHDAASNDNAPLAAAALDLGANPQARNREGLSPLEMARTLQAPRVAALLTEAPTPPSTHQP